MISSAPPHIVIIGAGFGGLQTAISLGGSAAQVTLIDRNNYHTFVPLLYQVATATLEPEWIALPIHKLLHRYKNVQFVQGNVEAVDLAARRVQTEQVTLQYDYLVLATGSQTHFQGVPGAKEYAWPLRTLEDAIALKHHLLQCIEQAAQISDSDQRRQRLTITVVGGGATGVEVAGALVELCHQSWPKAYPWLRREPVQLILIQSGPELLPEFPHPLRSYTYKKLARLGVQVQVKTKVASVHPTDLELDSGVLIPCATTIWTAGVQATHPPMQTAFPQGNRGKCSVLPSLQLQQYPEVYVLGDAAQVPDQTLAGVAPEALQQGVCTARNLRRQLQGRTPQPFRYFNKGRLAIIGCFSGVGKIGPFPIRGFLGWFLWLAVHLVYTPGYRNRFIILMTWLQSFTTKDKLAQQLLGLRSSLSAKLKV
ncbi:NAD(P)/FAD-dependent oxidoreductase [Acaryochloris sp. IP29b_bin.137]|uniref:NAD(P)/FAD-dependent oxidoreductase n=1 Tax=Acaryochloris sp. IP29b_bin.137 TaxID=2969217 RepID=UPI002606367C|nr:NAD(P)/FAD-dependent oxidoreductase [Acaryochloris sp. IP29b_bin.137]